MHHPIARVVQEIPLKPAARGWGLGFGGRTSGGSGRWGLGIGVWGEGQIWSEGTSAASSSALLLSNLELSNTKVYEP